MPRKKSQWLILLIHVPIVFLYVAIGYWSAAMWVCITMFWVWIFIDCWNELNDAVDFILNFKEKKEK